MPSALRRQPLALLGGVCALGLLSACDVTIKDGDVSVREAHGRALKEIHRAYPLDRDGRVEIVNSNGSVDVSAGSTDTVDVKVVITARAMTDERAADLLARARIDETASPQHVRIVAAREGNGRGITVSFTVSVPPGARVDLTANNGRSRVEGVSGHVKAMMVDGELELRGLRGSVDAASVNGTMTVRMAAVTDRIRLDGTNGRIGLELPKDTKATLNVRSVNGGITVTGLTAPEVSGRRIRSLESQLNGGGPEIDVRATNGRITITGTDGTVGSEPVSPVPK